MDTDARAAAQATPAGAPQVLRAAGELASAGQVLRAAGELASAGQAFALATVVWRQGPSSGKQGSRAIITADGTLHGWIGGACAEPSVIREARAAIADGEPRLLLLGEDRSGAAGRFGSPLPDGVKAVPISCQSEGALEVFIEPVLPAPHLLIVGASPMAGTLARLAQVLDWRVELVDGPQFTQEFAAAHVTSQSLVVVATQGHGDEDMIARAVAARPAYLGLVASRKRGEAVVGYLADRGLAAADLDRVRVPAGLDLGRTTHAEMAVAIMAELVALRAGTAAGAPAGASAPGEVPAQRAPLPHAGGADPGGAAGTAAGAPAGPAAGASAGAPAAPPAEVTDPVCGMTVPADAAHWPLQRDGVTYYFCCAGCRTAFESAALAKEARP